MPRLSQQDSQESLLETPFFFRNGQYQLFGILHRPTVSVVRGAFVFCHPCFEEKLWAHRVFVTLARELAARGYYVLRFDYMGHGDSDGDFAKSTIGSRLSDLACAINLLRQEVGADARIGLLGLRLGATLAAVHAENDPTIARLVLWDPIIDGASYMQELLLSNLATQSAVHKQIRYTREDLVAQMRSGKTVNIEGYELSHEFYDETTRLQISGEKKYPGSCLIVQIGRSTQKLKKTLEMLSNAYPQSELTMTAEEPFWKEIKTFYPRADNLFDVTFNWLQRHEG